MHLKKLPILLTLFLFCAGCIKPLPAAKTLSNDEGEIYIYAEPFPQDANRLSFSLDGITAVRADGIEIPISLRVSDFNVSDIRRQRLMAVGVLPAGQYSGFSVKVRKAELKSEEGVAALLPPEQPEKQPFPFEIKKKSATVLSLAFKYRESIRKGYGFNPEFLAEIPASPLPTLTGYVSNSGSNTITVFDKRTARVAKVIETGRGPAGIVLDQVQMKAYVALSGDDAVETVDVMGNEVASRMQLRSGDAPRDLALTPDGRVLLTVNTGSNSVSLVDPVSQVELTRLTVGSGPGSILLDRAGRRAYVFNNFSNTITVIDIANRSVAGTIGTDSGPLRGQFNKKGDRLYVCHSMSPNMLVFDPLTLTMIKKIYVGIGISTLRVNTFSDLLYAAYKYGGNIDIFDPFSLIPGDFLPTSGGVGFMTIDGDENNLAVVHPAERTLQLVNLVSKKEVAVLDVGEDPYWVTMFGEK